MGALAEPFNISLPAVSRHLRVLERARVIERRVDAQWRVCRLRPGPRGEAAHWINRYRRFWEQRLDDLRHYFWSTQRPFWIWTITRARESRPR